MLHGACNRRVQCGAAVGWRLKPGCSFSQVPLDLVPPKSIATDFKDVCERLGESVLSIEGGCD